MPSLSSIVATNPLARTKKVVKPLNCSACDDQNVGSIRHLKTAALHNTSLIEATCSRVCSAAGQRYCIIIGQDFGEEKVWRAWLQKDSIGLSSANPPSCMPIGGPYRLRHWKNAVSIQRLPQPCPMWYGDCPPGVCWTYRNRAHQPFQAGISLASDVPIGGVCPTRHLGCEGTGSDWVNQITTVYRRLCLPLS
jgi:hypothetical protein